MADIKISELSQAESLSLSDLMESAIPYNGGFQSRRMTLAQLSNYLENSVLHNALDTTTKNIIGAINEILHDLANYYTKQETYSKTKIDELIAGVSGLHFLVVQTLPVSDIDPNTIYLVPKQDVGTQDIYDEFIYIVEEAPTPSHWEKIGTTEIDLSDYVTDTELATELLNYVTTSALNTTLQSYATTSAMTTALADKVDKVQGKGLSTEDYTTVEKAKLNGIEPSAQVNVQSDWTETDASLDSYIWNKPNVNNVSIAQGTDFGGVLKPIAFTEFYSPTNENTYNHGIFRATDIWKNSNVKGTTSVIGQAHLYAGNWLTNGQEYNAKGYLGVYDESDHTAELTVNGTLTASRTYYLPDEDGTLALVSDIPTDFAVSRELMTEDLNDVKTVGFYVGKQNNTCANKPSSDFRQFGLMVIKTATSGNYYKQILIRPNAQGETWSRSCVNGTWSAWGKDIDNRDIVDFVRWSEQNVLGAKNLITFPYYHGFNRTSNNVVFTVDNDGTITVGGTQASANASFYLMYNVKLPNGTYTLSDGGVGTTDTYLSCVYYTTSSASAQYYDVANNGSVTFTVNNWDRAIIRIWSRSGKTADNLVFKPMLRLSTISDNTFVPYAETNRQLTLNKLSWEENKASGVKNYFTYPYFHPKHGEVYNIRDVDYTDNGDGGIIANGTCDNTGNSYCQLLQTTSNDNRTRFCRLPQGKYHFSGGISEDYYMNLSRGLVANPSATRTDVGYDYGNGFDFEVTEQQAKESYFCSFCFVKKNVTADNVIFYPMITRYEDSSQGYAEYAMTNKDLTQLKADMDDIAPTETSGNASRAYAIGDYMFWRGGFYRVTAAIASGGAITQNTNVVLTTLGAELKRALS